MDQNVHYLYPDLYFSHLILCVNIITVFRNNHNYHDEQENEDGESLKGNHPCLCLQQTKNAVLLFAT
jgi:hypothetical protein